MTTFGIFLAAEEHGPRTLVEQAQLAERAGFEKLSISDHFHPWMDAQGHSPFVWGPIGGIAATTKLEVTTGVTCPILRIHPAIVAQAAATASDMLEGRFRLGVGTGERLNEHILGQHWPPAGVRQDMLEEAIELMRALWSGELVTHHGEHFTTENARIYTTPPGEVPVLVSAFGPEAAMLAGRVGDGFVSTSPDSDTLDRFRTEGGTGPAIATVKVCWAADEDEARKTAHRLWAHSGVPGASTVELAMPAHFEEAAEVVTPEMISEKIPCGPDPDVHLQHIRKFIEAGFDEVHLGQVGDDITGFLDFFTRELAPKL